MNPLAILPSIEQQLQAAGLHPDTHMYHNARRAALVMALARLLGISEIDLVEMMAPPKISEAQR